MNTSKSGRRYDKQFKEDAVALVRGGREIVEVARISSPFGLCDTGLSRRKRAS